MENPANNRMPILFVGHGSPIHAIEDDQWSRGFTQLRTLLPQPKAILAISAHWYTDATLLTANEIQPTIHDFSGFPQALYDVQYPAKGSPDLAARVRDILRPERSALSTSWGLDHGAWSVLRWIFPLADVPTIQLSINAHLSSREHIALARSLTPLRDEGVLIVGSGNITHNLRDAFTRLRNSNNETPEWAASFDTDIAHALEQRDEQALCTTLPTSTAGQLSHPSPDHYLPLLYSYGASLPSDSISFPITGFDLGSLSMRCVVFA